MTRRVRIGLTGAWLGMALVAAGCRNFVTSVTPSADGGPHPLTAQAVPAVVYPNTTSMITISGGLPPYFASIPVGNQHSGNPKVSLSGSVATYVAGSVGDVTDVVVITDSAQSTIDVPISVGPVLTISPTSVARAPRQPWSFSISGGAPPYSVNLSPQANNPPFPTPQPYFLSDGGCPPVADAGASDAGYLPSCYTVVGGVVNYQAGSYGSGGQDILTVNDNAGATAHAAITIGPGLELEPVGAKTIPGGSVFFQATGGVPPYVYSFTTHGNQSGGSVFAGGTYQAGPNPHVIDVIYAQDAVGVQVSVSVEVDDQQITLPTGRQYSLYTGDFNGDGFADVVAISQADSHPLVVTALGSATGFIATTTLSFSSSVAQVVVGDFNHDGFDDLVLEPLSRAGGQPTALPQLVMLSGSGSGNFQVFPLIDEGAGVSFQSLMKVAAPIYQYSRDSDGFGHPGLTYVGPGGDALLVMTDVEGFADGGAFGYVREFGDGGLAQIRFIDGGAEEIAYPLFSDGGQAFPYTQVQVWTANGTANLAQVGADTFPESLFAQPNPNDAPFPGAPGVNDFSATGASLSQATFPDSSSFPATAFPVGGEAPYPADFDYVSFVTNCDDYGFFEPAPAGCNGLPLPCGDGSEGLGTQWPLHLSQVIGFQSDGGVAFGFNAAADAPALFSPLITLDGGWACFPLPFDADPTTTLRGVFLSFDYSNPQPAFVLTDAVNGNVQVNVSISDAGIAALPIQGAELSPDGGDFLVEVASPFSEASPVPAYWGTRAVAAAQQIPGQIDQYGDLDSTSFFGTVLGEIDAVTPTGIVRASYQAGNLVTEPMLPTSAVTAFVTADIDGDGLIDAATIDNLSNLDFVRGGPSGQPFVGTARQLHQVTAGLDVGDVDGDGIADILVPDLGVRVFYGDPNGLGASPNELGPSTALGVARGGSGAWALVPDSSGRAIKLAHVDFSPIALGSASGPQDYPARAADGGVGSAPINLDPTQSIEMVGMTANNDPRAALILGTALLPYADGGTPPGVLVATLPGGATNTLIPDVGVDGVPLVAPLTAKDGTDLLVSIVGNSNACGDGNEDDANLWQAGADGGWGIVGTMPIIPCDTLNVYQSGYLRVTGLFSVASETAGPLDVLVAALSTYGDTGSVAKNGDGGAGACNILDADGGLEGAVAIWGASDIILATTGTPPPAPSILAMPVEVACGAQATWSVASADFDRDGDVDLLVSDGQVLTIVKSLATYRTQAITLGPYLPVTDVLHAGTLDRAVVGDFNGDGWPDIAYTRFDLAELQVALFHPDAGTYY